MAELRQRMQNRFGIKDFFLFALIVALIAIVVVAMIQFDRQYERIMEVKEGNSELRRDIAAIRRQLAEGVVAAVAPTTQTAGGGKLEDPFRHLKEAEKLPDFARGDWYIDNFSAKIGKLTPFVSSDIYQRWVEYLVTEGLAIMDPETLQYAPKLARSWEISPDGLTMRFFLRRGVTFSDGETFDADDVIATFAFVRNPSVMAERTRAYLTELTDVKKIDQYAVEFSFKKPFYLNFDTVTGIAIMPEHFLAKFKPEEYNEKTGLLMGTGPYRLENPETWTPGQLVQLYRNDRYWGTPPTFDRIIFKEVESESTEMVIYGNQELDMMRCVPDQYARMVKDERIRKFSHYHEVASVFKGFTFCAWNQMRMTDGKEVPTLFADKRVRTAMTMLLDRERMAKEIMLGYASVASGPFAPTSPQSAPDVKPHPYSGSAAKALLAQAGFEDRNGDGVLESADGKPFRFALTYPSSSDVWEKTVLFMKDSFARAGIVMEPDRVDWPVLVQKLNQSNFDAVTLGWSSTLESDPYQIYHSSQIKDQGDNRTHYSNPQLDELIEKARVTTDAEARMKMWQQVHRILHEDQPYTFLFNRKELMIFNSRIHNVKPSKMGLNFEHLNPGGVIPWFVPQSMQRYTK